MATYYYSKNQNAIKPISHVKIASPVKEKTPSVGEKLLHTTGDVFANIIAGAAKGLEGIVDLGVGIGGAIAGIFDKDARDKVRSFVSRDFTGDLFANRWQQDLKYSYLNDGKVGQFAEKTLNAVGQMLPAVGVGLITGGAGLAAGASQAASLAAMGASAAGTSTEEAFNDGADYMRGLGYGMASGAVEMATEKMSGGALKGIIGKGMLDGVGKVAATGARRVLKNAVEEGAEEVVSELANPALKSIYKGKEAFEEYRDADYWKGVAEAGLVGGATSVVYGGTVGKVLAKTGHGYVGKEADIADSLSEISTLQEKANKLQANGELSATNEQKIADTTRRNYKNIEKVLQSVSEDKRAQYIKKFGLEKAFNTDGSMSGQMSARFNSFGGQNNLSQNEHSSLKKDSYSFNLRGQEQSIQADLDTISEDRANTYLEDERKKGNEISVEQAREAVGKFRVFSGEMSDTAKAAKNQFNKALNYLNKESGANVSFVITENNKSFNGLLYDDKIYIGEDQFENGTWAGTLVHEYTHLSEDSDEYRKFVDFVATNNFMVDDGKGGKIELWKKGQESVLGKGYVDGEIISETLDKIANNEQLTAEEQKQFKTFMSEVRAHEAEYLLGNEDFIDSIVAKESSFARKFVKKIEDLKKAFERVGDKSARQAHKQLLTAEKLWLKAAYKAGDMKLAKYILAHNPELEKDIDGPAEIKYNKKDKFIGKTFPPYSESFSEANERATRWAKQDSIKEGWQKLISFQDNWYLVEKFSDMDNGYQIVEKVRKGEYDRYAKIINNTEGADYATVVDESVGFYENGDVEQGVGSNETETGRTNISLRQMAQRGSAGESSGVETRRNSEQGDRNQPIKYSLKTAKYIPYDKVGSDNIRTIRKKLNDLYQGIDDAVADGIAIENGDTIYVVDSGKDSGEIKFGVRERYEITNDELRAEFVRRINYESVSKRYISDGLSSRFRFEYAHDRTRNRRQEPGKELSVDTRESADKEKRISVDNADRRSGFVKYSLKTDSDGRQLSESQREYFKDSKVVDKDGNLLVMYHGTNQEFNIFDLSESGKNFGATSQGFFFFTNKKNAYPDSATDYAREASKRVGNPVVKEVYLNIKKPLKLNSKGYYNTVAYYDKNFDSIYEKYFYGDYDGVIIEDGDKSRDDSVLCLVDSAHQIKNVTNTMPTSHEDIRYSLKPFSEQVDDVLTGEHDSNYDLYVGETPKILLDIGFESKPLLMRNSKINEILAKHKEMNAEFIKKIPQAIANPIMIIKSKTNPTVSVVVITDIQTSKGEMIIPVWINQDGTYFDVELGKAIRLNTNFVASAYGRSTKALVEYAIENNEVLYYAKDKKRVSTLLATHGLQLPARLLTANSNINISNYGENVNTEIKNSEKIKYSVKENDESVRKYAQNNAEKVYGKSDAREILKRVCACLEFDDGSYGDISGHKGKTVDMLYDALNTKPEGERYKVALDIADYILSNVTLGNIYTDEVKRAAIQEAITTIDTLRPFLHNLNLDSIKGDIRHRYDKNNRPFLLWKARSGNFSVTPDVVAQYLAEKGIWIKSENEAAIFFEIDDMYMQARSAVKSEEKKYFKEVFDKSELAKLRNEMAKEILLGYDNTGEKSAYARMKNKYEQKVAKLKEKVSSIAEINSAQNELIESLNKLKNAKTGEFFNSTQYKPEIFKGSIEKLTRINYRGNINKSGTREIVRELRQWYSPENDMFKNAVDPDENMKFRSRNSFNPEIANVLDFVIEGKGELSLIELKGMKYAIDYFTHFIENHNKIYRAGKYVEAVPVAAEYVRIARENKNYNMGWLENAYTRVFGDPASVVRLMDKYERGFYTEIYEELRNGAMEAQIKDMEMRSALEEFFKKNKRYVNRIAEEKVKYYVGDDASKAKEINKDVAIALYLTLKRKQALKGLAHSGFLYVENGKDVRVPGFLGTDVEVTDDLIFEVAGVLQKRLYDQFSDADKQYINVVEKVLNEDCKKAKYETDMRRQGYSNVLDDYYFPIRRAFVAKNVDDGFMEEINSVSNASMNKNTKKGAKNELLISPVNEVVDRHIRAVAMYSSLAEAIDNYNILFNVDVAENKNKPFSVRTETSDIWRKKNDSTMVHRADEYFRKLVKDIQGISADGKTVGARVLAFVRGGYAKFQLGFNVKVLFSQLSSYFAASNTLSSKALAKGFGVKGSDVDKYCRLAALRNFDKTAIKAQGVIDKVGAVGDVLMAPISKVDRFVVQRLFGACQAQAEINGKGAIGTESNLVAAGELLTKVILETQQNSLATERSAAMRSGNEFMKGITMFTADSMKCVGRVIDAIGEITVLKKKIKNCTDSATAQKYRNQLKTTQKKAAKSVTALVTVSVYMACIAQLFRWLYKRDDNENVIETMSLDAVGNLLGGLPLVKDLYAKLVDGFDLDNYAYGVINDLFDSADGIIKTFEKVVSGDAEKQDFSSLVKKMIYAAGQLFGIPVRNMYNMATGITRRISPAAGYKIDSFFYDKNYRSDLKKAIEDGDEKMIATIAGLIVNEDIGNIKDKSVREEFDSLVKDGYDVLPRTIGKEIAVSDGTYTLNRKEKKYIENMYDDAAESLSNIMKTARYRSASKSVRAKTIKNTYKMYYEKAVEEITDEENLGKSALYSQVFDPALLAFVLAAVSNLKKDENSENGTRKRMIEYYLNSLNLTSAQKILIMGYLGYKTKEDGNSVRVYIARYDLSAAEQKALLAYCGY